ncbi:uncharacterized protein LOC108262548 [Ictalurus punctatus]|uniref:Uncharacterized protein LOC108262548 n=1 Tax=Ictalurus punctatus TaxID=7998 RepID=A0A9F7TIG7_ICTPU|nr:uncharacterized protein LOC108262548 [Ictalurus punctatus]
MMLCLKLTLLTLLIAAPGLLVSGENVITCDGDIHRLTCDRGLIWVENSLYGRTDSSICSTAHPPLQVTDTSCSTSISTIAERCNGLSACEVNTAALQTSDPCKGTYKYYDTSYSCYDAETTVICEHSYSTLECAQGGYLQIINANFGRSDSTTCSSGLPSGLTKKTNCYASNTLSTLATLCNNQQSCTVEASSTIFSDPCPNTAKYLSVSYICYGTFAGVPVDKGENYATLQQQEEAYQAEPLQQTESAENKSQPPYSSEDAAQLFGSAEDTAQSPGLAEDVALCPDIPKCSPLFANCAYNAAVLAVYIERSVPVVQHFNTSNSIYIHHRCFNTFSIMMLCLKLTLLTLLIAAPGLLVSGENVITCDGDIHRLTCDRGLIWVENSLYGRTDSSICSTAHPPLQVTDTSCSTSISTIAERCNGLSACEVNTAALQTSDPCKGTYKYYDTSYSCYGAETTVICEHSYSTLECAQGGYLQIINANFGRSDSTTCSSGLPSGLTKKTNCYASNTLSTLATLCNNQQSCTVEASSTIFSDPCPNTAKYLSVSYICYD